MSLSIRKLPNGKHQADVRDRLRGIPRTKRTFDTKKEALEWGNAALKEGSARLLGHRERRLFGQALTKYLLEVSPQKNSYGDDLSSARALRWPAWDADGKRWVRLEDTPLDEVIGALNTWSTDLRLVVNRAYLGAEMYHYRRGGDGRLAWYHQPHPDDARPQPRREVKAAALLADLNKHLKAGKCRGPFSNDTLRVRQAMVSNILKRAWRDWEWLDADLSGRVVKEKPGRGRKIIATYTQLRDLVIHLPWPLDAALLGATRIGWRRGNVIGGKRKRQDDTENEVLGLTWDRVAFSVYEEDPDTGRRTLLQGGVIWVDGDDTKNGAPIAQPMSEDVEQLLTLMWEHRSGRLVFHRGDGQPWGDFRKVFARAKVAAGAPPELRWHDLRHTWATNLIAGGANPRHVQELGGWRDGSMVQRYSNLNVEHLRDTVNKPTDRRS